jgi:glycosyltransferase involved in cell wall biosynthesis
VAVSAACADWLAEAARLRRSTVQVLPNGIDAHRFEVAGAASCGVAVRSDLGFGDEDRLVLVPAVLRVGKGHDRLLQALPEILAREPRVRLLFAGAGERERELRSMSKTHGDRVCFLGERSDMAELMAASDVVVLPSDAEALPTVLIEAAAAGRPVVATHVGGAQEIVEDGRTGLLVPAHDPTALARAMVRLLTDRTLADSMGRAARQRFETRFTLDRQLECTFDLWREVLAAR